MGSAWAAVRLLIGAAIRVDPRRAVAVLVLSPSLGAASAAQVLGLEWMVDGAVRGQTRAVAIGATVLVAVTVLIHQVGAAAADTRLVLQQRVALEFDRRFMALSAGRIHIDHYQDAAFLDTAELLRQRRGELGNAFASVVENANVLARFVAAAVVLATASPVLGLLPLATVPLILATRRQERMVGEAELDAAELDRTRMALFGLATDPAAARELRVYRLAGEISARHRAAFAAASRRRDTARARGAAGVTAAWSAFVAAMIGGLVLIVHAVAAGTASPGEAVLVLVLGNRLTTATVGLSQLTAWLRRSLETASHYLRLAAYPQHHPVWVAPRLPSHGDLAFEDVSFTYPGRCAPAVAHLTLRVPAGSTVAVVGDNGAGKSTMVALLAGLYRPSSGRITLAGHDLSTVDPDWWRSQLTASFQDFCRFELPLRETVGLGDVHTMDDRAAVQRALARTGAGDLVAALPDGLDTQLGRTFPGGTDLSAGQWQKVALARARMRPAAALILLDEPTASLDPDTEAALLTRYLDGASGGSAITFIVSHRLTSTRAADLIVVMDRGGVAELGTHTELIARGGRYAKMYALHAAPYAAAYR